MNSSMYNEYFEHNTGGLWIYPIINEQKEIEQKEYQVIVEGMSAWQFERNVTY